MGFPNGDRVTENRELAEALEGLGYAVEEREHLDVSFNRCHPHI